MKRILFITLLSFTVILSSCLYTLHPIFKEDQLLFDNRLLGTWEIDKKDQIATYSKLPAEERNLLSEKLRKYADNIYLITKQEPDGPPIKYFGFLVKLGENYFLDLYPIDTGFFRQLDDNFRVHFTRLHSSFKIHFVGNNSFELKQFDDSYLKNLIDKKQIRIQHEVLEDGNFLITAPTEELQQYIIKYGNNAEAYYSDFSTYKKIN